jgi:hypothetical protein
MRKDDETITKYTNEYIDKMQVKFNSKNFSDTWYRKHFREMMRYIKWLNGNG